MDYFGYHNARVAGANAGRGIHSSARWATERVDGFPPPMSPMGTRDQLRYVRARMSTDPTARLSDVVMEVEVALSGVEVDTPLFVCPPTRKRSRKQAHPRRLP